MSGTPDNKSDPLAVAARQALAMVGAIGLLSLTKDLMTWQHDLATWIDAFRTLSRPLMSFLFGWIAAIFHLNFPDGLKDYLCVGLISLGALLRAEIYIIEKGLLRDTYVDIAIAAVALIVAWPVAFVSMCYGYIVNPPSRKPSQVFASVFVYFALIVALNYALIAGGAKTGR